MSKTRRDNFAWTTGRMQGISHVSLIARGGYGEVHKANSDCAQLIVDALQEDRKDKRGSSYFFAFY